MTTLFIKFYIRYVDDTLLLVKDEDRSYVKRTKQLGSIRPEVFLEISQNSQGNTFSRASFLIKLQALGLQLY